MNCNHCQTRNPIGSKFCRQCGKELVVAAGSLAEEETRRIEEERAREQAAELLARAHRHFERGETDEAIPLAEEAARLLPASTAAHALCATLYERAHRTDEAIGAMEKVVALNPESAVDRDKLDRMRRGVHFLPKIEPVDETGPRRAWLPWAGAAGVALLVLAVGIPLANRGRTAPERTPQATPPPQTATASPQPAFNPVSPGGFVPAPRPNLPLTADPIRPDPFTPIAPGTGAPAPDRASSAPRIPLPNVGSAAGVGSSLPRLGDPGQTVQPVPPVVIAAPPGNRESIPAAPPQGGASPSVPAAPPNLPGASTAAPPSDSGYIRIQVNPPKNGGGQSSSERGGPRSEDPMLRAQMLQAAGRFREAIAFYRNALTIGADPGECHQGMAICHQRIGEADAAREAYRKAIVAYEKQRNTTRWRTAEKGLSACRAALEVLGE